MISRLWLKNKKLDKFDHLDSKNTKSLKFCSRKEEWALSQTLSIDSPQRHQADFLQKVLLLEWLVGQKFLSNKSTNFNKFTAVFIKLRRQKLFVFLDILINVLFLSNHWVLIFDKSQILLIIKNTSELHAFIDNFHLNGTKSLFDAKSNSGNTFQVVVKNFSSQGFYKLINK